MNDCIGTIFTILIFGIITVLCERADKWFKKNNNNDKSQPKVENIKN